MRYVMLDFMFNALIYALLSKNTDDRMLLVVKFPYQYNC